MKINKILSSLLLLSILFALLFLVNCKKPPSVEPIKSIQEVIKGKTYILGDVVVVANSLSVTNEFTGFTVAFNAEGNTAVIASPTKPCLEGTYPSTITGETTSAGNIVLSGNGNGCPVTSMSNVVTSADGSILSFKMEISSSSIVINPGRTSSVVNYGFNLVKQ